MIRPFHIILFSFFLLISCSKSPENKPLQSFDRQLRHEIDRQPIENYQNYKKIIERYLKEAEKTGYEEGKAHCYINLAELSINTGKFNDAVPLLKKAEEILKSSDDDALKAYLYNTYAVLCYRTNLTDHPAMNYSDRALKFLKKSSEEERKVFHMDRIYATHADFHSTREKHDSASVYLHKALKTASSELSLARTAASLAELKIYHFHSDSADFYLNKALQALQKTNGKTGTHVYVYHVAGTYYSETGQYRKAEEFFNKALAVNHEISYNHLTPFLYSKIQELYFREGDKEKEQYYTNLSQQAREQMYTNRSQAVNTVNEKLISDIRQEKQEKLTKTWIYIGIFVLAGFIISIIAYKRMKSLKLRKELLTDEAEALRDEKTHLQNQFHDKRFDELIDSARKNDPTFLTRFTDLYPDFILKLQKINPDLEKSELIFCAMLKLNFSSKEIAQNIAIQHTSVQKRKSRIRKRLYIDSETDLYDFLNSLD